MSSPENATTTGMSIFKDNLQQLYCTQSEFNNFAFLKKNRPNTLLGITEMSPFATFKQIKHSKAVIKKNSLLGGLAT